VTRKRKESERARGEHGMGWLENDGGKR